MEGRSARADRRTGWRQILGDVVRIDARRGPDKLLVLLLVADAVLVTLHLLRATTGLFADLNYAIDVDRGFGETFQYLKFGWLVVVLIALARRLRSGHFAWWAVLASVLLYDDMFSARERYGGLLALAQGWQRVFGIRGQDFGELIFIGIYAVIALVCAGLAYRYSRPVDRRFWWQMAVLLGALISFGVVLDVIHVMLLDQQPWDLILGTTEEGGEMVVASLMVRLAFDRWYQADAPPSGGGAVGQA